MTVTRIYNRLPSDAGVTFEGFEDIKLKSRETVKEKLEDFIDYCKNAYKPAIRVILGEWGEGKTDAYRRYIEPKAKAEGNYAFFVSASTLSNGYEAPTVVKLLETTSLSAVRFLVVLFSCIREESRELKIPDPQGYQDAFSYLNATLNNLIGEDKKRRIFIFIDEFEELLLTPARLKGIISGIKETINGRYTTIDEGGEYAGCVHLILAVTPDAYYRLQVDEETALIFGGLGRRIGVIDLPQIRKEEGITFLFELLKYAYKNNLPDPLPFYNLGIFNGIFRIAQGNPGNIVSLFTRLMNSARVNEESIKIIDSEHFLKFLEKEYIFVYGGSTACLETETFHRFLRIIEDQRIREVGEKCSLLLKIIVGEFKPFSAEELEKRIGQKDVKNLIAIINNDLKSKEEIEKAILKVSPLRQDKTFQDIQTAFKDFITLEKGERYIKIDNYSEQLEVFEDRISFFEYEGGSIIRRIYLPSDRYSIMSFFEGITFDGALEIEYIINRRLCEDEDYYVASDELLSQIFPTPIPRELDFIKSREKRLKLWRDVTRNLAKEYESCMPEAFIYLLKKSKIFSINETAHYVSGTSARFAELMVEGMKINTIFFPVNGDVKGTDIEELWRLIRRRPPTHIVFLIFTGELTQEAEDKIKNKEMGKEGENIILEIRLHPTLVKRIICMYKASFIQEEVDESLLSSVISRLITQELDIPTMINNWLKEQENKGVVINELSIEATSDLREFADTLKFFINFIEYEGTTEEIFNKNQELLGYTLYAKKKEGLIPDIQLPKFNRIVEDLLKNGFLARSKDKHKIQRHPVENRILRILERETKISQKELEEFFILKRSRYLSDVFLPILEYKGLVKKDGDNYSLTNKNDLYSDVDGSYKNFKQLIGDKRYQNYGCIYITKQRDERFISLTEFEAFIDKLHRQIQEILGLNEELVFQKLSLMKKLLEHFIKDIFPLLKEASNKSENILIDAYTHQKNVDEWIKEIIEECDKWLKLKLKTENVVEYKEVQKLLKELEKLAASSTEDIKKIVEKFKEEEKKTFFFSNDDKSAFYFNPKFYKMSALLKEMEKAKEEISETIKKLEGQFEAFNGRQKEIESALNNKNIDEKCIVSYSVLNILGQLSKNLLPQIQPMTMELVRLDELLGYVQQNIKPINSNLDSFMNCVNFLDELNETEHKFLDSLKEAQSLCSCALSIFDIEGYIETAKGFEATLRSITSEYACYSKKISSEDPQSILKKMKDLKSRIDNLKEKLTSEGRSIDLKWGEYVNTTKDFIYHINDVLGLLQRLSLNIVEIINQLDVIQKSISAKHITELDRKLSELEQIKHRVRDTLYEASKNILTDDELKLIEFLVEKRRRERREWLPVEEIYQFAKVGLQMDLSKVTELLRKLVKQGIIIEGITLVF